MNRRQLAKSAAWSVPAIAIGVAAPARAASSPVLDPASLQTICKFDSHNHGNGRVVDLTIVFPEKLVFVTSVTVGSVTTEVGVLVTGRVISLLTDPIPNKELSGPNTPVTVLYTIDGEPRSDVLRHGAIPDCE